MSESEEDIEIFYRVNKLKLKAGAGLHEGDGYMDRHAVYRAQMVIDCKETLYRNEVEEVLKNLKTAWNKMKSDNEEEVAHREEELYHYANHVKDLATTYNYQLMGHFGTSLRTFAEKIDVKNPAHLTIVQAHLDVMSIVYKENIKDEGGEKATELKQIVEQAIKKYF